MKGLLLALTLLSASFGFAKEDTSFKLSNSPKGFSHGVGAGGTIYETWGFMYRHHFDNGLGLTTSLGGWINDGWGYLGNELGVLYTFHRLNTDWDLFPNSSFRFYGVAYLANIFHMDKAYTKYSSDLTAYSWKVGLGVGPGVEFFFNDYLALHVELPWMTFAKIAKKSFRFSDSHIHVGGGVIFYF